MGHKSPNLVFLHNKKYAIVWGVQGGHTKEKVSVYGHTITVGHRGGNINMWGHRGDTVILCGTQKEDYFF